MNKVRRKIYLNYNENNQDVIFSGIEFGEFLSCLNLPMENILIIKGDLFGNKCYKKFELFEGKDNIEMLLKEDLYNCGDFCFIDYKSFECLTKLNKNQIAELLYLGYMHDSVNSPFFDNLQNRFAYLSHDDGYYCKLFCRDINEFVSIIINKLSKLLYNVDSDLCESEMFKEKVRCLMANGIIIDLNEITNNNYKDYIYFYEIGKYEIIDEVLNNFDELKMNCLAKHKISFVK